MDVKNNSVALFTFFLSVCLFTCLSSVLTPLERRKEQKKKKRKMPQDTWKTKNGTRKMAGLWSKQKCCKEKTFLYVRQRGTNVVFCVVVCWPRKKERKNKRVSIDRSRHWEKGVSSFQAWIEMWERGSTQHSPPDEYLQGRTFQNNASYARQGPLFFLFIVWCVKCDQRQLLPSLSPFTVYPTADRQKMASRNISLVIRNVLHPMFAHGQFFVCRRWP